MPVLKNRAYVSTATTGTGTITLGSPISGYQSFADAGVSNGDTVRYTIEDGANFEIGEGVYTATGTTLSRTPSESSNSGSAINLSGNARVFITPTADDIQQPPSEGPFVDGDKTKLDGIETGADVTDAANVEPLVDAHLNTSTAASGELLSWTGADYDWVPSPSPDLYAENYDGTSTLPSATGSNAVALNVQAEATGAYSTALGFDAIAAGTFSTASGQSAYAGASRSIALGFQATTVTGSNAVALGKSYASGTDSFASAITSNLGTYGATGANSVAIGQLSKATGTNSVAIGNTNIAQNNIDSAAIGGKSNVASGHYAIIAGGNLNTASQSRSAVIGGQQNTASGSYSIVAGGLNSQASGSYATVAGGYANLASAQGSFAHGQRAKASEIGKKAFASGYFAVTGDAQGGSFVLRSDTTDATAEALTTNNSTAGGTNQIILPNSSAYSFSGTIIAREQRTDGSDYASWEIKGALLRDADAASTVLGNGIVNKLYATSGASTWAVALSADTTNGGLKVEVTGAAATNIRWVATVHTSEVTY